MNECVCVTRKTQTPARKRKQKEEKGKKKETDLMAFFRFKFPARHVNFDSYLWKLHFVLFVTLFLSLASRRSLLGCQPTKPPHSFFVVVLSPCLACV